MVAIDPLAFVKVESGRPFGQYRLIQPDLSPQESHLLHILSGVLSGKLSFSSADLSFMGDRGEALVDLVRDTVQHIPRRRLFSPSELVDIADDIHKNLLAVGIDQPYIALKAVYDALGLGDVEFLIYDPSLEEIMVNGEGAPVFVYHSSEGYLRTNIVIANLRPVLRRLYAYLSERGPLVDGHLPDGSRINIVYGPASRGPALTIRKFRREHLNLIDIVKRGTMSPELVAYLWLAVEGMGVAPQNVLISGNTGSGKTTTLNALLDLLPLNERIITIEDTRELHVAQPNHVALATEGTDLSLNDLLINALRMRPDRIIVGEVRGPEAETLLASMNVGHRSMGTLHANSARDTLRRLTTPPMSVPRDMLPVLDILVVQHRLSLPGRGVVRRVVEVVELSPLEGDVHITPVFRWDPRSDKVKRTNLPLGLLDRLAEYANVEKSDVMEELKRRTQLIKSLVERGVSRSSLIEQVNAYYMGGGP